MATAGRFLKSIFISGVSYPVGAATIDDALVSQLDRQTFVPTVDPTPGLGESAEVARENASATAAAAVVVAGHDADANAHGGALAAPETIGDVAHFNEMLAAALAVGSTSQVKVMSFGDSLPTRSTFDFYTQLVGKLPLQCTAMDNSNVSVMQFSLAEGAYVLDGSSGKEFEYQASITGVLTVLPDGGTMATVQPFRGQNIRVYYRKGAGNGSLLVESSPNNSDWTTETTLECNGASGTYVYELNKTFAASGYHLRMTASAAAVRVVGAGSTCPTRASVQTSYIYRGGLSLAECQNTPDNAILPILTDIAPDLLFVHLDDTDVLFNAFLPRLKGWMDTASPRCSVVLIGNGPKIADQGGDAASLLQCAALRNYAVANGWAFVNGMAILGSYEKLVALGWEGDGLHLHAKAYAYQATRYIYGLKMWPEATPVHSGRLFNVSHDNLSMVRKMQFSRDPVVNGSCGWVGARDGDGAPLRIMPTRELEVCSSDEETVHFCISNNLAIRKHHLPQDIRIGGQTGPGIMSAAAAPESGSYVAGTICINTAPTAGTPSYWQCTVAGSPGTWVAHNL